MRASTFDVDLEDSAPSSQGRLTLRLGSEVAEKALPDQNVRPMDFTGRPMKGFVFVSSEGTATEERLRKHVESALGLRRDPAA